MMSNDIQTTYSGERYSFYQLFSKENLRIEIPIIQRDYAQGRETEKEVRTVFLDALFGYLQKGKPFNDLDFVYGSILKNKEFDWVSDQKNNQSSFVPLDGQQRLTTLFLLHWYLAQISGKADFLRQVLVVNQRSQFSYETRDSSRAFCDALITHDIDFNQLLKDEDDIESVATTIKDRSWFYLSWIDDLTIRAMLTMLDAIHAKFKGCTDYFDKLVDLDNPVITFRFLDLKEFNLTDDLYIKMNARGKPLTEFENFKAQFEKSIKYYKGQWPEYRLGFSKTPVSGYEYFIHKIDNNWADLFWSYRNTTSLNNTFDDELMNFIALVIANHEILRIDLDGEGSTKIREQLFGSGGKLKRLSFIEYENLGCFSQQFLINLIEIFDLINHEQGADKRFRPYLSDAIYYSEEESFKKVISNNTTYPEKLRFYAFYAGLSNGLRGQELDNWMRVIFNLTENRIFNNVGEFHSALKSIRDLVMQNVPILELLKQDISITGFMEMQVLEEKIKAHLIDISAEWKNAIFGIESHPFFRGQIGFILKFAGIVDYYLTNKNTKWDESDHRYLKDFKRYAESASVVFDCIKQSSKDINFAWERAVLAKGNYLITTTANRLNLLNSRVNRNNIERDYSWKRLLRLSVDLHDNEKQSYVKAVLDDNLFSIGNVRASLEAICSKDIQKLNSQDWKFLFVNEPALFEICQQGFIVINSHETVLLHESQRNHYHSEIYSKYLHLQLEQFVEKLPFEKFDYKSFKSSEDDTFIKFSGFNYLGNHYAMEVWYRSNRYSIFFHTQSERPCDVNLIRVLENCDFNNIKDSNFDCIAALKEYENGYFLQCDTVDEALEALKKILYELKKIAVISIINE